LSAETSHPAWLLQRWIARFGEAEARALALADNDPPRIAFRFNERVASKDQTSAWMADRGIVTQDSTLAPDAAIVARGALTAQSEPVRKGWIYLQDEASQLVAHLAAGFPPDPVLKSQISNLKFLDLCAAPGSKTTLLYSLLPDDAQIVAADLHLHRLRTMSELIRRQAAGNIRLIQLDAERALPFDEVFDRVLLDAPCSGMGTLQRHPEIKWRMNAGKIAELAELQKRLIERAARHARPGGLLTYAVCSTEPEEGEGVIAWFRGRHSEFRDMTRERLVEIGIDPSPLLTSSFGARTFPHRHSAEGFFFCTLWKRK
jgi:16S rRNA (cytosine967-C5)-methyltransferase